MKSIRSPADLAINGAPPAFPEPVHVGRPNLGSREKLLQHLAEIYDRKWLTNNGQLVQALERRIAGHLGVKHCVAMCNGTIALEIAIRAVGFSDEVIVPSWTFIATAHALHWQGLTPVFADIDSATHNLDPEAVRQMITPRTTGIIGVHLWGRMAPTQALQQIADDFGLKLLFDAAHAFGSGQWKNLVGKYGSCEVLSFHATKVFNTFEGGAVVTGDDALAEKMRLMRNFGFSGYDNVIYPGTNGKMPEINAAMGLVNLDALDAVIKENHRCYETYKKLVSPIEGITLLEYDDTLDPNFQYIVLSVDDEFPVSRDAIVDALHAENVLARKYFWPGCHKMKPYRDLFPHAELLLPNTREVAETIVVLPTGPTLARDDIEGVVNILDVLKRS